MQKCGTRGSVSRQGNAHLSTWWIRLGPGPQRIPSRTWAR